MNNIKIQLENNDINEIEALRLISEQPNIQIGIFFNNENKQWAVSLDGYQTEPLDDGVIDVVSTVYLNRWQPTIREALLKTLEVY